MTLQRGIDRIETKITETWDCTLVEKTLVFDYDSFNPRKREVIYFAPKSNGQKVEAYVVTSIEQEYDGKYAVRGRLIQKDGNAFRRNYSEFLGWLQIGFFGEELS